MTTATATRIPPPPRARENIETRGRRLLAERRVAILSVHRQRVYALVRGDSGTTHRTGYIRGRWVCDCPARGRCAHIVTIQCVIDLDRLNDRSAYA